MKTIRQKYFLLVLVFFAFVGVLAFSLAYRQPRKTALVIGAKNCTEGQVVAEIIAQMIEKKLGIEVVRNYSLDGTFVCFNALKANEIDLYIEYTGSAYVGILKKDALFKKREEVFQELQESFSTWNIKWMEPLGFQNSYALMVNASFSIQHGIRTLSDLKCYIEQGKEVRIGFDPEFYGRPEADLIQTDYQIPLKGLKLMDHSLLYLTLFRGAIEVINGYTTDGMAVGLVILEDDLNYFPSYEAVPIVHEHAFEKFPGLEELLRGLKRSISEEEVRKMNYAVENNGESVYDVARAFLKNHRFAHVKS